jgi:hypothetical protein
LGKGSSPLSAKVEKQDSLISMDEESGEPVAATE